MTAPYARDHGNYGNYGVGSQTIAAFNAHIRAMLAVSTAVTTSGSAEEALHEIAIRACAIASADASSVLELTGEDRFRIVATHQLGDSYRRLFDALPPQEGRGRGPSAMAVRQDAPVVIDDVDHDSRFERWASIPRQVGMRSIVVFPLRSDDGVLGALGLYRRAPGPWDPEHLQVLRFVADHAAVAVRIARLLAEERRQVQALERLVRSLREQTHEHANRLHAIAGMLALGSADGALDFLKELNITHVADRAAFDAFHENGTLAALLWVETIVARQRSIELMVELSADLRRTTVSDAQAVTIVGNLLDNAFDAVAAMPAQRRRVGVVIDEREDALELRVRDWGNGVPEGADPFRRGYTSKPDHTGVGLTLVSDAVTAARGTLGFERHRVGVTFVATLPLTVAGRAQPPAGGPPRNATETSR